MFYNLGIVSYTTIQTGGFQITHTAIVILKNTHMVKVLNGNE